MITKNGKTVQLTGRNISYIMIENNDGDLLHFHFGKKLPDCDYADMEDEWSENLGLTSNMVSLDVYPQEYPAYGYTDLRCPAYSVMNKSGSSISRLRVKEYKIREGTADINGMPHLYAGNKSAQTLEIIQYDDKTGLEASLFYTVFDEYDIIARSTVIRNRSDAEMTIDSAFSSSLDLPIGDYEMLYLSGTWGRERDIVKTPLKPGIKAEASNARGGSGHEINPFAIISRRGADEDTGEAYGFSLIYSGNHCTAAEADRFGSLRVRQGINPLGFAKTLSPGGEFYTPQSVLCYSRGGFGALSREYHDVYRSNLMTSKWTHESRPVLINNWEGTYFDFTEEKLLEMAKSAKELGLDLFVLDDGWFGRRDSDNSSLGDWVVNYKKLPSGIDGLAEQINKLGMKFGLWIEPEMVNPDSDLFRAHPDWIVHTPGREPAQIRNQYILDLSRGEVCDYIIGAISAVLEGAHIEYIKWDMNRQMTDMPRPGYNHEYTLGFYKIIDAVTKKFPDILIEGCSAGGGRFDPGVLAYAPQIWASDDSDAIARLKIQYGTSMCYPVSAISTHVTVSPNHQCGRITSLKTRGDIAYAGTFGYELDVTKMTAGERAEVKAQIAAYRRIQPLVREGDLYRLQSPFDGNYCSWELVSKDKSGAFVFACKILAVAQSKDARLKLRGLDENKTYVDRASKKRYSGPLLMNRGIKIPYAMCDFATVTMELEAAE